MNTKVGEYGLTLLELCKTAIHRSVNNRRKSISKPTDPINTASKFNHKYLLVTYSSTNPIVSGWDNTTDYFLKAIESLQPTDNPNFGSSLSHAFRLLQSNPNQILSYGQGWKSWQSEMNVIIILSYCINNTNINIQTQNNNDPIHIRNQILNMSKRNLNGDELESDWITWNTRIFVGNINLFGTLHIDNKIQINNTNNTVVTNPNTIHSIRDALNNLCLETSPTDHAHVIDNELRSLGQIERWVTAIMRDNSRDGVMVEFWDSSQKEEAKFNDGRIFREFIIPTHCDCKWPIPESYSPKEKAERNTNKHSHSHNSHVHHDIPSRKCRPQIAISRAQKNAACLPRSEWNVPYEQYEITSPRFRDYLMNLPANVCYYAYIQFSAGTKFNFAKPWGALKGDTKRNKAFLYVFVYDFPFIWNQVSVFLQAQKRNFHNFSHEEWKRAVAAYLNFIPCYYIQSVNELLMNTTKGVHMPNIPTNTPFDPSITSYLTELQRKWRNNNDYKVKAPVNVNPMEQKMIEMKTEEINVSESEMDDEFNLNCFPFDDDNSDDENNVLLNAIYKNKNQDENDGIKELMQLPFIVNSNSSSRKRNWSEHNFTVKQQSQPQSVRDKDDIYNQRRKRRRLFHEKIELSMPKNNGKILDDMNMDFKANINDLMSDLRLNIFGEDDEKKNENDVKMRTDSFDTFDTKLLEMDAQNKLLNKFATRNGVIDENNNNNINNLKAYSDSFIRNRVSVYGHNDISSWKNQYKLVFDQNEYDKQHIEKHNNMGNYTMYNEKLRIFKKDEFRNPFNTENEYNNYALSLSFVFLQEKINKYKKNKPNYKSYLETESRLKSQNLLSIDKILKIKNNISQSIWTKNEILTRVYDENSSDLDVKNHNLLDLEYEHQLLKSPDWLSCQVLHNLKPTNLGGNPFKKRRKKSPFPTQIKPRNININNPLSNSISNNIQLQKQKESQTKFEKQVEMSLPHISNIMNDNNNNNNNVINIKQEKKEEKVMENNNIVVQQQLQPQTPPQPPSVHSNTNNKIIVKPKEIIKKEIIKEIKIENKPSKPILPKISKPILPRHNYPIKKSQKEINKAIEMAKNKHFKKLRQTQILPMKRKNNSNSNSNSNSSSPTLNTVNEPAIKKQKICNGMVNKYKKKNVSVNSVNNVNNNSVNDNVNDSDSNDTNDSGNDNKKCNINHVNNHNNIVMNGTYNNNNNNNNNSSRRQTTEMQTVNILLFIDKYRQKIRSQNKFDNKWFENEINCLNGLNYETKTNFYELLINEAKTYNRYDLAQYIHKICNNS